MDGEDGRARSFMTKVYPAPHIGAVITGTGIGQVVTSFYLHVVGSMVVNDVVHLSEFAPRTLTRIWEELADQLPEEATTTIYTFGISDDDGEFTGFAYRSTSAFEPERLQHGTAMKPQTSGAMADLQAIDGLAGFVDLSRKQQNEDRAQPRGKRVGIGGDLWLYVLRKNDAGKLSLQIEHLEEMAHFEDDQDMILAKLPENLGHPLSLAALASDP